MYLVKYNSGRCIASETEYKNEDFLNLEIKIEFEKTMKRKNTCGNIILTDK